MRAVGNVKFDETEVYDIGKQGYGARSAKAWFATKRIDELMEWLNWLNNNYSEYTRERKYVEPALNAYTTNPIKLKNDTLHGSLGLIDNSAWKFVTEQGEEVRFVDKIKIRPNDDGDKFFAIGLIPDYTGKRRVPAELLNFNGIKNVNVIDEDNPKPDKDENHEYTLIKEIGKVNKVEEAKGSYAYPRTDEYLINDAPRYEKYGFIIPTILYDEENRGRERRDYYAYKFRYRFKRQSDKFPIVCVSFPLTGCGFSILDVLEKYNTIPDTHLK